MLNLQTALAAASLGDDPTTNLAKATAERRPRDGWLMEFSAANVATWESAAALERGQYDQVPGITRRVNRAELRTVQRRSALLQNAGRGYYALGDHGKAVRCILAADEISSAEVRTRPTIREIVGQMMRDAHRAAASLRIRCSANHRTDCGSGDGGHDAEDSDHGRNGCQPLSRSHHSGRQCRVGCAEIERRHELLPVTHGTPSTYRTTRTQAVPGTTVPRYLGS